MWLIPTGKPRFRFDGNTASVYRDTVLCGRVHWHLLVMAAYLERECRARWISLPASADREDTG